MICQFTPELIHLDLFRLSCESGVGDRNGHAAIFDVKVGKKTNTATEASRERSAEQHFNDLESVA